MSEFYIKYTDDHDHTDGFSTLEGALLRAYAIAAYDHSTVTVYDDNMTWLCEIKG